MNGVDMAQLVDALTKIASVLNSLGVPGLVALAFAGPAAVLCVILAIDYHRSRKTQELLEMFRAETRSLLEIYRGDSSSLVRELGNYQRETAQYYRDNVELVKQYERVAANLQDVVVMNTRTMERLVTMLENRK